MGLIMDNHLPYIRSSESRNTLLASQMLSSNPEFPLLSAREKGTPKSMSMHSEVNLMKAYNQYWINHKRCCISHLDHQIMIKLWFVQVNNVWSIFPRTHSHSTPLLLNPFMTKCQSLQAWECKCSKC